MKFWFSEEQLRFRDEVRLWLQNNISPEVKAEVAEEPMEPAGPHCKAFMKKLGDEGWLNSVSVPGRLFDEVDDDVYETEDVEEAEYGLDIELDIGIGSASIEVSD